MKTILLLGGEGEGFEPRYLSALGLARRFGSHIRALGVTTTDAYVAVDPFGGTHLIRALLESIQADEARVRTSITARLAADGVPHDYRQDAGGIPECVAAQSRLADLVVLGRPETKADAHASLPIVADIAIHAQAPVLLVPERGGPFDPSAAALVAWNGAPEAAAAIKAAVPLLKLAASVTILTVGNARPSCSAQDACDYLARYDIPAQILARAADASADRVILDEAARLHAGWIVMGAYGHSRARQWLLGGVSRQLLQSSPLALFLAH